MSGYAGLGSGNDKVWLGVHGYRGDDFWGLYLRGGGYNVRGGSGEPIWVSGGRNKVRDWLNWTLFRDDDREPWLVHLVRKLDVE